MHNVSYFGLLTLAFLGLLMLGGLALVLYSIVTKRHWLTILMAMLPVGLAVVLSVLPVAIRHKINATSVVVERAMSAEVRASPLPDEPWSETLPPTADIYPSVALCGRPLAFQIAEGIRREKRSESKFAVTFAKEKRPGDLNQWTPPVDFVTSFRDEFVKQFPGSSVGDPLNMAEKEPEAESTSENTQPLEIKLSFKPSAGTPLEEHHGSWPLEPLAVYAGTISARWTTHSKTRAVASIDAADKPWVIDPEKYLAQNSSRQLAIGFSPRLARSPEEATAMALNNLSHYESSANTPVYDSVGREIAHLAPATIRAMPNQVVDRFVQKLSLPYGELWQESVLVDQQVRPDRNQAFATGGEDRDLVPLVRNREGDRAAAPAALSGNSRAVERFHQRSRGIIPGLILTVIGLITIGVLSNLLTQGYYRQNIKHTVITGVAVVFGFLILVLFMG